MGQATDKTRVEKTPAEKIKEERAKQEKQNTLWRRIVFWSTIPVVVATIVASFIVLSNYLGTMGANASPTVISAWFAASVVQVIGILVIITRHLFPDTRDD
ncbi:hypothetical protein [Demequina oxidasica]|uniref:hypothetical protein n=1 Tax=Demequina oxidasica TaxID=676199 RepID=UPI00128C7F8F|nr:hypothetical protein [Demequina oxidasica]